MHLLGIRPPPLCGSHGQLSIETHLQIQHRCNRRQQWRFAHLLPPQLQPFRAFSCAGEKPPARPTTQINSPPHNQGLRPTPSLVLAAFTTGDSTIFGSDSTTLRPISGQPAAVLCQPQPPSPPPCRPSSIVTSGNRSLAAVGVFGRKALPARLVLVCLLNLVRIPCHVQVQTGRAHPFNRPS